MPISLTVKNSSVINRKSKAIGVYKLSNGPKIFNELEKLHPIGDLLKGFRSFTEQNYRNNSLCYFGSEINKRPLCLFAIEIENQVNRKYLFGDFFNSLMLAKYPMILLPEKNLEKCFGLLKLVKHIFDVKEVDIYNLLRNVMIITIQQFREVCNPLLKEYEIEPLGILDYQ